MVNVIDFKPTGHGSINHTACGKHWILDTGEVLTTEQLLDRASLFTKAYIPEYVKPLTEDELEDILLDTFFEIFYVKPLTEKDTNDRTDSKDR